MKELLGKLQQYPKTWEKFIKWFIKNMPIDGNFDDSAEEKAKYVLKVLFENNHITEIGIVNHFLTSFCDGEGYYVTLSTNAHTKLWVWDIDNAIIPTISPDYAYPSRQEAFEQGIIKAFSLMETKGDK